MRESILLQLIVFAALAVANWWLGPRTAHALGFGIVAAMAAMIALTFLWLWHNRATPLALGMAFSWAGTATVLGWFWLFQILGRPDAMLDGLLVLLFLGFHVTGAVHHFAVIRRSMGVGSLVFVLPLLVAGTLAWFALTLL